MSQILRIDRVVLAVLLPAWALCFALALKSQVLEPAFYTAVYVETERDQYPRIASFNPMVDVASHGARIGDRVRRVGAVDQRGANPFGFFVDLVDATEDGFARLELEREDRRFTARVPGMPLSRLSVALPSAVSLLGFALAILVRAPRSPLTRTIFYAFVCLSFVQAGVFTGSRFLIAISLLIWNSALVIAVPLLCRAVQLFPHGAVPDGGWARLAPLPFFALGLVNGNLILGVFPGARALTLGTLTIAGLFAGVLVMLRRAYLGALPEDRRKLKWLFVGLYASALPVIVALLWTALDPGMWSLVIPAQGFMAAMAPAFVYVALHRSEIFDVDRALSIAASYNVVVFGMVLAGELLVPRVADTAAAWVGLTSDAGQLALSVTLAVFVVPAERLVRPHVDRILFRNSADAAREATVLVTRIGGYAKLGAAEMQNALEEANRAAAKIVHAAGGRVVDTSSERLIATFPSCPDDSSSPALATARRLAVEVGVMLAARELKLTIGVATGEVATTAARAGSGGLGGSTVHRATQLEALARDLGCQVVVDSSTLAEAAEADRFGFEIHEQIAAPGLSDVLDLASLRIEI